MRYVRQLDNDTWEGERLFDLGYRQVSRSYGTVARVDVPDVVEALKKMFPFSAVENWDKRSQEEYWRRCYSKDRLDGVPERVLKVMRKIGGIDGGFERKIMVCVNNEGIEYGFDKGIEYVVAGVEEGTVWVHNKFGKIQPCVDVRFEEVKNGV